MEKKLLCWDYWRKEKKGLRCGDRYGFQLLPLNKLLSATHIIRLSGEIVRLRRREKEREKYVVGSTESCCETRSPSDM